MKLGSFSISLAVKDIHKSKAFYESLGFSDLGGDIHQEWLIMKNGNAIFGLFQGMFEDNINFSVSINTESKEEADKLFNALSTDGKTTMPVADNFRSAYFGMFTDQFGIGWMVTFDPLQQG